MLRPADPRRRRAANRKNTPMTECTVRRYGLNALLSETRILSPELTMTYGGAIYAAGLEDTPVASGDRIVIVAHDDEDDDE